MRLLKYLYIISHHSLVQGCWEGAGPLIFQNFWTSIIFGLDLPEFQVKSSSIKTQILAVGKCLEHTDMVNPEGHGSASVSLILAPYFQMGKLSLKEVVYPWATVPGIFEVQDCAEHDLESIVPCQQDNYLRIQVSPPPSFPLLVVAVRLFSGSTSVIFLSWRWA